MRERDIVHEMVKRRLEILEVDRQTDGGKQKEREHIH